MTIIINLDFRVLKNIKQKRRKYIEKPDGTLSVFDVTSKSLNFPLMFQLDLGYTTPESKPLLNKMTVIYRHI